MKYLIPIALLFLCSCSQGELTKSNDEKDSILNVLQEREASLNDLMTSFNEVERTLDSVALKQHIIFVNTKMYSELKQTQKERVNAEINAINILMEQNNKKIIDLSRKLKNSKNKNAQTEKTIATLNNQLRTKYYELKNLNTMLAQLNSEVEKLTTMVDTLSFQNTLQAQTIVAEKELINTAYYIVGTTKDLQKEKLIDKKGGVLGIGRTTKLNENFDFKKFTKIDLSQITTIDINSNNAKIVSSHPADSYTIEKEKRMTKRIVITNPTKFWSISKYLIITCE